MLLRTIPVLLCLGACMDNADPTIKASATIRASHGVDRYELQPHWSDGRIGRLRIAAIAANGDALGEIEMWRESQSDRGAIAFWQADSVVEAHILTDETIFYANGETVTFATVEEALDLAAEVLVDRSLLDHLSALGVQPRDGCPWWIVGIDNTRTSICAWSYVH